MPGFFDKMKASVGEKVIEASIKSKEALETAQVRGKIGDLQNQKKAAITELGTSMYAMFVSNNLDQEALTRQCEAVAAIDAQIKDREADLEEIHRKAEQLLAEQRAAEEKSAAAASAPRTCPQCQVPIEGAPKFCPECGAKLG